MFEKLYPMACTAGVDPVGYWDMTYGEIKAAIDGHNERMKLEQEKIKADMQVQAIIAYRQAQLIGAVVARVLGDKHKLPSLDEVFPGIFPEEMLRPRQQDWRVMKARIEAYAARHRKRGEKRGDDDRGTSGVDHRGNPGSAQESGSGQETA